MKKLILLSLCFSFFLQGFNPLFAAKYDDKQVIEFQEGNYKIKGEINSKEEVYVRIRKKELDMIRRQAFISAGVLQRLRDLEKLYNDVKYIVDTTVSAINYVRKFLNLEEINFGSGSSTDFKDSTGAVMSPGFVEFQAKTPDANFEAYGIDSLEFDLYYNKTLFKIDHFEGNEVSGESYRIIPVSSSSAGAKDRILLPLSDILNNQANFRIYLAPRNPNLIKIGDSTKLDIKYYKNIPSSSSGQKIAPVSYSLAKGSANEIKVAVTSVK